MISIVMLYFVVYLIETHRVNLGYIAHYNLKLSSLACVFEITETGMNYIPNEWDNVRVIYSCN